MKKYLAISMRSLSIFAIISLMAPIFAAAYQAAPIALTATPTFITEKGVHLNGSVNANEMPDTYAWFEWGIAGRFDTVYQTTHRGVGAGTQLANFDDNLYGLAPNVQYFYRQVAENSRGKDIGQTTYFTTKSLIVPIDPIVIAQTNDPRAISSNNAVLRGYVAPHEGTGVHVWFQWGITDKFENETPHSGWGGDSGPVEITINGLTSGTVYYYRIASDNSQGTIYGTTKAFVTLGTPPPPPETLRAQAIATPQPAGDGVTRTVTTQAGVSGAGANQGLPGSSMVLPGNIFGSLFGNKQAAVVNNTNTNTATTGIKTPTQGSVGSADNSANQIVTTNSASPIGTFWNNLSGKKAVEVTIEKVGPSTVAQHTPIEYRITYAYRLATAAKNAKLKIVLPADVVYVGDNTTNELLLEEGVGPERTYDLPVGRIENGSTRTISILGITTGSANGNFPDARARLEYTDQSGAIKVVSAGQGVATSESVSTASSWSIFPSSLFGWILYVLLITLTIVLVRKALTYYRERKAQIAAEEQQDKEARERSAQFASGPVPAL